MEMDSTAAPLARPVAADAPRPAPRASAANPAEPLAAPMNAGIPADGSGATSSKAKTEATRSDEAVRAAEDQAWQNRKRMELVEKLVGANKSLVIEKDPTRSAGFIYKTVDRTTGEVVRVWPQSEVATRLSALADVDARGMMLNARA
jgi:uncharacterized FlaG/YvyC family protein